MNTIWFNQALERIGSTQAVLARHLRLAPAAVSRMLKGERQMKQLETVQIAGFLGVSPEEVLQHAVAERVSAAVSETPRAGTASCGSDPDPQRRSRRQRSGHVSGGWSDRLYRKAGQSQRRARSLCDLHGRRQHGAAL